MVGNQQACDVDRCAAVVAHQVLKEHFGSQLGLTVKGGRIPSAVVAETRATGGGQHPDHAGAADLHGLDPHFLDFPGPIKGSWGRRIERSGGERGEFVIAEQCNPGFVDCGVHLGNPIQPKPPNRFGSDAIGVGAAGQVEGKTTRG